MNTKRYYIAYGTLAIVLIGLAAALDRLDVTDHTMMKGLILFPLAGIVTSAVRLSYTDALLDELAETDAEACKRLKKTMWMLHLNYDPQATYSENTSELLEDYNLLCTWITAGVVALTLFLIVL